MPQDERRRGGPTWRGGAAKAAGMGVYLNPGNQAMAIDRRARVYVDKSGLITHLNERVYAGGDRYVCVGLPSPT